MPSAESSPSRRPSAGRPVAAAFCAVAALTPLAACGPGAASAPPVSAQPAVLTSSRLLCAVESSTHCRSGVVTECETRALSEDERKSRMLLDWERKLVLLVSDEAEEKPIAFILHDRLERGQRIIAFAAQTGPMTFPRLSADGRMTGERKADRVTFAGECSPRE
jgi:hypothetical protein